MSATLLGEPDVGLLTPPEMARKAGQIAYSIPKVPVLVDADTGGYSSVCGVFVECVACAAIATPFESPLCTCISSHCATPPPPPSTHTSHLTPLAPTHPCSPASGGGSVLNVQRTVRQLMNVGAKGCFLEDQAWPKKTGQLRNKAVISMEEFAAKV